MCIMPKIIEDITCSLMFDYKNKENVYCIGSMEKDKYFFVGEHAVTFYMTIIKQMDGSCTLEDIKNKEQLKSGIPCEVIDKVYDVCLRCNLIKNIPYKEKEFNEVKVTYKDLFKLNISSFSKWCKKIDLKVYTFVIILMAIIIIGSIFKISEIFQHICWNYVVGDIRSLIYAVIISTVSLILHELCHAIAGSKLDLPIKNVHFATFTYMTFACYVKLPGIYFLKPIKRIIIWLAGIFMNFFLIAVSIFMYDFMGEQGRLFLTMVIICNISIIISALIPFYISDGYFILSTISKAPNLRKNVFENIKNIFKKGKFYFSSWIYIAYFICTIIFSVFAIITIFFPILNNIFFAFMEGQTYRKIILDNINIFLVFITLIISNIIRFIIKKKNNIL
ncbi:MAG: M50 family metallopeptidase [Roseburia sp.]|nr:M50 family metallopeptidase [Roseburia sp.]MCM1278797.1 M50 family metallopeptidase [Robinsoniella sp.]